MFAPRSLRRSTSAPGRGAERGAETLGRSSPARGRKSVEPEVKALAKDLRKPEIFFWFWQDLLVQI